MRAIAAFAAVLVAVWLLYVPEVKTVERIVEKPVIKEVPKIVEKQVVKEVPKIIEREVIREVPRIVEREVIREVPKVVERIVEVPAPPKPIYPHHLDIGRHHFVKKHENLEEVLYQCSRCPTSRRYFK
jgi:hypothetical protein